MRNPAALLMGGAAFYLSILGHAVAGGGIPNPFTLAVLAVLALALWLLIGQRRLSFTATFAVLVAAELVLHVVLSVTSHHAGGILPGPQMLGVHVCAALIATVLLRSVDAVARAWSRFLASLIGERELAVVATPSRVWVRVERCTTSESWVYHLHARRGPPSSR